MKIEYKAGDTVKYLSSKNEAKLGIVKTSQGNAGEQIILLIDDSYIHEKQIIFRFDFRNMN
jgi:uncharacterized protein YijF (DUF1287 family)